MVDEVRDMRGGNNWAFEILVVSRKMCKKKGGIGREKRRLWEFMKRCLQL